MFVVMKVQKNHMVTFGQMHESVIISISASYRREMRLYGKVGAV